MRGCVEWTVGWRCSHCGTPAGIYVPILMHLNVELVTREAKFRQEDKSELKIATRKPYETSRTLFKHASGNWFYARLEAKLAFYCEEGKRMLFQAELRIGTAPFDRKAGIWPAFWALGQHI